MSEESDKDLIREIVRRRGANFVQRSFQEEDSSSELTIVSNAGLHPIPQDMVRGELYFASEGNLDFSTAASVEEEIEKVLVNLREKLFSARWNKIYLLPFGHSVISMSIKMAIFRLVRIETIDIFYFGNGRYDYVSLDTRKILLSNDSA